MTTAVAAPREVAFDRWLTRFGPAALWLPGVAFMVAFFLVPVGWIVAQSVLDPDFTLKFYQRLAVTPEYALVLWISIKIGLISTLFTMLAGYPVAYLLVIAQPTARAIMMAFILLPFWTNILVRCYAWMLVLQTKGLVNTALVDWFGIVGSPLPLLFNLTGVIIGMVHYLLPIAILTLYAGLKTIDLRLVRAAQGLGANPVRAFLAVFLPLSLPTLRATTMLVFVLSLGFYVTPALLGGRTEITVAMLVSTYFSDVLNWGFGAALAVLLLAVTLAGLTIYFALERTRVEVIAP
ncbi:MAG: ABC transporter permease [Alphaproteobacteria bacterium]|nr:ABC transporter permease [Alphaproteobacteria bacterium]